MTDLHDDELGDRLRSALRAEAETVQPSEGGLTAIRDRVAPTAPWWRHPGVLAAAAAVVVGVAAAAFVLGLGGDPEDAGEVATTGSSQPSDSPPPSQGETSAPTESSTPVPVEGDVYVYYLAADGDLSPRLYRETRPNIGADPVVSGLSTMLAEPAIDPDYFSPWPDGTEVLGYEVSGDTATVDVSAFPQVGAEAESLAVQQLVHTVTANNNAVRSVRLLVDGEAPPSGHSDWSEPVRRAPMVEVQGLIWLLGPTEGATVSSPVQITGFGTAFEATVSWEIRVDGTDTVVAEGFTMGGSMGEFAEFTDTVDLEPGTYELRAFESSAEDGRPLHVDSKTFTVE
jgi:hypothetical protein